MREECGEQRGREQGAVREVDDMQDAVDQRQAQRHKCIDCAGQKAVENGG